MKQICTAFTLAATLASQSAASELERRHGIATGQATAHQLAVLEALANSEDDFAARNYKRAQILSADGPIRSEASATSHAQLAASYGLDPVEYSVAEIVMIAGEDEEEQRDRMISAYRGTEAIASSQSVIPDHVLLAIELFSGPENTRD